MTGQHKITGTGRWLIIMMCLLLAAGSARAQLQGRELVDSLIAALPLNKEDTIKATIYNRIGNIYTSIAPDEGLKYASLGLALAQKLDWQNGIASSYNILGICAAYKSDYNKALEHWSKALAIFEALHNKKGILKIIGNRGTIYMAQGDYPHALENSFLALKYAEELGDKMSIALNLGSIGSTYDYLKDYAKALEYDQKALKIFEELDNKLNMATYLCNIGNVYKDQRQFKEALAYQLRALALDEQLGYNEGAIRDMVNIGEIYVGEGDHEKALEYYFKTVDLARKNGFRLEEAKALSSIGEGLLSLVKDNAVSIVLVRGALRQHGIATDRHGVLLATIAYMKKSIGIFEQIADLNQLQHDYYTLSEAQRLVGDDKGALASRDRYMTLKDSVFSMESKMKITNLETKRELELKNKQIEIHQLEARNKDKQITIDKLEVARKRNERVFYIAGIIVLLVLAGIGYRNLKLAAAKESSENKLNAFQARMNPHFIFNSLNSIQSLVLANETISSIRYLSEFSKLMRQILDNSAKSKVVLKTEIQMLRSYIELEHLRFDHFEWCIDVADNIAEDTTEVPGMIVQPFVENAILHGIVSKGAEGRLSVTFDRVDKHIVCTVEDNGVGRARSYEINSKRDKSRQSHGVNIATNRLTLLNDKKRGLVNEVIYIDKEEGGVATGTKVIIQIPVL